MFTKCEVLFPFINIFLIFFHGRLYFITVEDKNFIDLSERKFSWMSIF